MCRQGGIVGLVVTFCLGVIAASSSAAGDGEPFLRPTIPYDPSRYVCYRTMDPITIDGQLNEADWTEAVWTSPFVDIEGSAKPTPRFATRAKMLWDEENFYVAAEMEEPDVWGKLTERDAVIYYDNDFEVFIDPDGDTHNYYELEVNALGTEWDLLLVKPYRDGGPAIHGWDINGLESAVFIDGTVNDPSDTDQGWSLEIAFPWAALRELADRPCPPNAGDQWRVNFSRVQWQVESRSGKYEKINDPSTGKPLPEDNWVWSPQGLINMHYPEMWGFVQFSSTSVRTGNSRFVNHLEDRARWALRNVYYALRDHHARHGRYTDDLDSLDIEFASVPGFEWPPKIRATGSSFEAVLPSRKWSGMIISHDGRVWAKE